jgi:hypothetical protein
MFHTVWTMEATLGEFTIKSYLERYKGRASYFAWIWNTGHKARLRLNDTHDTEHGASPDLKKQRPASDLLDFLAYCEGVHIPLEFVLNSLDYVLFYANKYFASDKLVKESVVLIKKYNRRKLPRKKTISVHRLVQEIVRLKPKNEWKGKEGPWLREIISALSVRARKATENRRVKSFFHTL